VGKASAAKEARDVAGKAAKQDYVDFRGTTQAVFKKDAAARKALGATGAVLEDLQKFVSQAAASYAAAGDAAYAAPLAVRGRTTARLSAAHADLPALRARDNEFKAAHSKAVASTAARDARAVKAFWLACAGVGTTRRVVRPVPEAGRGHGRLGEPSLPGAATTTARERSDRVGTGRPRFRPWASNAATNPLRRPIRSAGFGAPALPPATHRPATWQFFPFSP
jgi:hypothetical protein